MRVRDSGGVGRRGQEDDEFDFGDSTGVLIHIDVKKDVKYAERSLFVFDLDNPMRRLCINMIESPYFENAVLFVILLNCIILALADPLSEPDEGRNVVVNESEIYFNIAFTVEMTTKIIALGFWMDENSYLRDGWNVIDFIVVIGGWVGMLPFASNVTAIRTIRLLRPLRTISVVEGMRILVGTIVSALPLMGNVLLVCLFFFCLFGILGILLFSGTFSQRCVDEDPDRPGFPLFVNGTISVVDEEYICSTIDEPSWPGHMCGNKELCYPMCAHVTDPLQCQYNPTYGITHFDNIFYALNTIFQCMTLEGWTGVMYNSQDATNGWSNWYFIVLILFCGFFLINLTLGVVAEVHSDMIEEEKEMKYLAKEEANAFYKAMSPEERAAVDAEREEEEAEEFNILVQRAVERNNVKNSGTARGTALQMVDSKLFQITVILAIVANTIVLAIEFSDQDTVIGPLYGQVLDGINLFFTVFFTVEMLIKMFALGLREYSSDNFNLFDALIVVISLVELVGTGGTSLSAFRAVRILRVLKLARSWRTLQRFLVTMWLTMYELGNFAVIVLLIIFIFALLGMNLFGGKFDFPGEEKDRSNYDTLLWALITVFQVITGEDWVWIMYNSVRATDPWTGALYYILLICIGNFIVMNLFLAILLSNFGLESLAEAEEEQKNEARLRKLVLEKACLTLEVVVDGGEVVDDDVAIDEEEVVSPSELASSELIDLRKASLKNIEVQNVMEVKETLDREGEGPSSTKRLEEYENESLGLFPNDHPFRKLVFNMVRHRLFDHMILSLILVSAIIMAVENPKLAEDTSFVVFIFWADVIFTVCFSAELIAKHIAYGAIGDDGAYWNDSWNVMDGFVVILSIIILSLSSVGNLGFIKTLRTLRVLRPLRVIKRVPELKVVVNTLFACIPGLVNVIVVSLLFWMIFGIMGMNLFMGMYWSCSIGEYDCDAEGNNCLQTVRTKADCKEAGGDWTNSPNNFDNLPNALLNLFEMATTEGWVVQLHLGVDAVGIDQQPIINHQQEVSIFFIVFMLFGSFFILNLFVGIILDNFNQLRAAENTSHIFLTKDQKQWSETLKLMLMFKPHETDKEPDGVGQLFVWKFVKSKSFENFIMSCIFLNSVAMMTLHYPMDKDYESGLEIANVLFTGIFCVEALIKLYAFRLAYFTDNWNNFDLLVTLLSVLGLIFNVGSVASALRVLRVIRVVRLVRGLKSIRTIFNTLIASIPTLMNVFGVLFLIFFIYAVAGVQLFGKVVFQEEINEHANFTTFGNALLILFRMSTGEAWNVLMYECMIDEEPCSEEEGTCGSQIAPVYFVSFVILGAFVMLNLVIAVVLENFTMSRSEQDKHISNEDIEEFREIWNERDTLRTLFIPFPKVEYILRRLKPPLGPRPDSRGRVSNLKMMRYIHNLNIRVTCNFVYYGDVLNALTSYAYGFKLHEVHPSVREEVEGLLDKQRNESLIAASKKAAILDFSIEALQKAGGDDVASLSDLRALNMIQAFVKGWLTRRRAKEAALAKLEKTVEPSNRNKLVATHLKALMTNEGNRRGKSPSSQPFVPENKWKTGNKVMRSLSLFNRIVSPRRKDATRPASGDN